MFPEFKALIENNVVGSSELAKSNRLGPPSLLRATKPSSFALLEDLTVGILREVSEEIDCVLIGADLPHLIF